MLEPLTDTFMQRAIAEIVLIGLAGAAVGCWVNLYELSYAAESLAHSLLPGLVIAALAGVPLLVGATPAIALAALLIALVPRVTGLSRELSVAVVVTTLFGAGALLALAPASPPGLDALLFGDILGVSDGDLLAAVVLAAVVAAALWILHHRLLTVGFDRTTARALGASPALVDAALLVLLAAVIVVSVQGLGNLLVVAVIVGPGAAARRLTNRMGPMLAIAAGAATLAGIGGLYLSYYAGTAAGASIALAIVGIYVLADLASRLRAGRAAPARREATIG